MLEDLNLNISREILQQDRQVKTIRKRLVKKVLDSLKDSKKNDSESYENFWNEFGQVLKEGLYSDMENRETILGLMLANTTNEASITGLADYSDRMKEAKRASITSRVRILLPSRIHHTSNLLRTRATKFFSLPIR